MVLASVVDQRLECLVISLAQLTRPTVGPMRLLVLCEVAMIGSLEAALRAVKHHAGVIPTVSVQVTCAYTVGHKKRGTLLFSISSPIIDRFTKFFNWHTLQTICNNGVIIYPTTQ